MIWNAVLWFLIGAVLYFVFAVIRELYRRNR
jgi:hypothetical protein